MRLRVRDLVLLVPLAVACGSDGGTAPTGSLLQLERDGQTLLRARASGSRCAADSTIAVVAVGAEWAAALSMRLPWPLDSGRALTAGSRLASTGTATVAARPVADSVGPALVSARGTVLVEAGRTLSGRIDMIAPTLPGAPDSMRITGRFGGVRITDDLCPTAASP